jgi:hypothetical protein
MSLNTQKMDQAIKIIRLLLQIIKNIKTALVKNKIVCIILTFNHTILFILILMKNNSSNQVNWNASNFKIILNSKVSVSTISIRASL